MLSKVTNIAPR